MTIKRLIELLSYMPDDAEVQVALNDSTDGSRFKIKNVWWVAGKGIIVVKENDMKGEDDEKRIRAV